MAEQQLFSIAQSVLQSLGTQALAEVASAWGFRSRLEKLKNTINMIKDVLADAEERQAESYAVRNWLERLTTAVYAADDLFDEFATVASQRQAIGGNRLCKEVRIFFSNSNQIAFAFNMSEEIKRIREKLDEIAADSREFGFVLRPREEEVRVGKQPRNETHSYIATNEVIGREDDKKAILDIILSSASGEGKAVSIIPIVGIGGLGKTTLAQLIYNDDQILNQFDKKLWVCVSDPFDVKETVQKILMSAKDTESRNLEMDQLQGQLRKEIGGRKYFLVLDDVWNENPEKWLMLSDLLKVGKKGSKVLVTTRSHDVARIMGTVPAYDLQGLSEEKSWALFEKMAFETGEAQQKPQLVKIGRNIVKKCGAVPLAIRSLGTFLRGTDEKRWLNVEATRVADLRENQTNIMTILKISYDHLWPPLKNCFAYCALFPKDTELEKEELVDLWMAEGFVTSVNQNQDLEELAEEYFMMLLRMCFFQDIEKDKWGNIISCKMHDLMHDLAIKVAGAKTKVAKSEDSSFSENTRHLSLAYHLTSSWQIPSGMLEMKQLRTILLPRQARDGSYFSTACLKEFISNFRCLRELDLQGLGLQTLPKSIGNLIHLRCLVLSNNPIEKLPHTITALHNLQTLTLYFCLRLRALPNNLRKLTNLRNLDLRKCYSLTHLPSGIGELTSLRKLTCFMVKHRKNFRRKLGSAELKELKTLNNLRGSLKIQVLQEVKNPVYEAKEANLSRKHGLTKLHLQVAEDSYDDEDGSNHDEAILEGMKPHPNLKGLCIYWYRSQKLPSWAMADNLLTTLPNLVKISLSKCGTVLHLASFSQLCFLKCLKLISLESVEYIERGLCCLESASQPSEPLFFPALEKLTLRSMDNLKGWWEVKEEVSTEDQQETTHQSGQQCLRPVSFLKLAKLCIQGCRNLACFPLCPNVEELTLLNVNENLLLLKKLTSSANSPCVGSSAMLSRSSPTIKTLRIDNAEDLISLPEKYLNHLSHLAIEQSDLPSTSKLTEVFKSLSSLTWFEFASCANLISITESLEHLTALEKLDISSCNELDLSCNAQLEDGLPWNALKKLRSLKLHMVPKLVNLPSGFQHLTDLSSLELTCNDNLIALPEWISCMSSLEQISLYGCPKLASLPERLGKLTSLNMLLIMECPELTERYRAPNGPEWSKIQHIPWVQVRNSLWD